MHPVVVIGGGFFGCEIAIELARLGLPRIVLVEREAALMRRASFVNQARVHQGYHYPRDLVTAERSRANYERFRAEYAGAIGGRFTMLYAVAALSRVSPAQFERVCATIGAPCALGEAAVARLFDPDLVAAVYRVEETAFDAALIAARLRTRLAQAGVEVRLGCAAQVLGPAGGAVELEIAGERCLAAQVFNCTYAEIDAVGVPVRSRIKRELAEIALFQPPPELARFGVTVIDGPFFSFMPFPPLDCHSLTHVRYTPHESWTGPRPGPPAPPRSNAAAMQRDAARYLPRLAAARAAGSLFEIKAVRAENEENDGRPVLFETSAATPRMISVLGAKIDNIYEVRELLRAGAWRQG